MNRIEFYLTMSVALNIPVVKSALLLREGEMLDEPTGCKVFATKYGNHMIKIVLWGYSCDKADLAKWFLLNLANGSTPVFLR